jgi:hypothetical protein
MKTEEEIRQYFMQYKFKSNPNHFIIVDKYNRREFKTHEHEIFDYISKCVDEMIIEACYKSTFPSIDKISIGVKNKIFDVDDNEHMWYNKFNKWNWTKFENGVIQLKGDDK